VAFRPHNESSADLAVEREAAGDLERAWRCSVEKLSPTLYGVDWALYRQNRLVSFAEFKARGQKYDTLLLSLGKVIHARALARGAGVPFIVVVRWPDGLFYWRDDNRNLSAMQGGRVDRGQSGDTEPVVHVPTSDFKLIIARRSV
jgi:hypothetical protein